MSVVPSKSLKFIPGKGYAELVRRVKDELTALENLVRTQTALVMWRLGKSTHEHLLKNKDKAGYGKSFYENFAKDIGRDISTVQRAEQFYLAYPIPAERRELTWNHYKSLITIEDKSKREAFEEKAMKKGWTAEELSEAIRLDRLKIEESQEKPAQGQSPQGTVPKLSVTRSRMFTYQVLEPSYIQPVEEQLVIDLGFKFLIHAEIKGIRVKEGEIIESIKEPATKIGGPCEYSFKHSDASRKELYTYKALVEKVVDGDTLWLNIDVGFSCWSRQKVRFRGIDCPEIDTKKGQEAKEFVEARLKEVSFIVVKTHKSDKYDRYLADIFFLKDEENPRTVLEEGIFLNQELLDAGLAKEMKD